MSKKQNEKEELGESGLPSCLRNIGLQTVFGVVLEIGDKYFGVSATGMVSCGVRKLHIPDSEAADFRSVVQREHEFPARVVPSPPIVGHPEVVKDSSRKVLFSSSDIP